jgi:hypothetical protein
MLDQHILHRGALRHGEAHPLAIITQQHGRSSKAICLSLLLSLPPELFRMQSPLKLSRLPQHRPSWPCCVLLGLRPQSLLPACSPRKDIYLAYSGCLVSVK